MLAEKQLGYVDWLGNRYAVPSVLTTA